MLCEYTAERRFVSWRQLYRLYRRYTGKLCLKWWIDGYSMNKSKRLFAFVHTLGDDPSMQTGFSWAGAEGMRQYVTPHLRMADPDFAFRAVRGLTQKSRVEGESQIKGAKLPKIEGGMWTKWGAQYWKRVWFEKERVKIKHFSTDGRIFSGWPYFHSATAPYVTAYQATYLYRPNQS